MAQQPYNSTHTGEQIDDGIDLANTAVQPSTLVLALEGKQDVLESGVNIKTVAGQSLLGSTDVTITKSTVGLSNVDNTSDASKPVSTAQQAAIDNASAAAVDTAVSEANQDTVDAISAHVAAANPHDQYALGIFQGDQLVGFRDKTGARSNVGKLKGPITSGLRQPISSVTGASNNYMSRLKLPTYAKLAAGTVLEVILPTYQVQNLSSPGRVADIDYTAPFRFQVAVEPVFIESNSGLDPLSRISAVSISGQNYVDYDPGTGPFAFCKMYVVLTQDIPAFSFFGLWTYIENKSPSGPYYIPLCKPIDNVATQRYEFTSASATSRQDQIFTATSFILNAGVADAFYPVSVNAYVYDEGDEIIGGIGDSIPEGVYDQMAAGSNTTGGCERGDKWGNAGIFDKLIGTRMGKASVNVYKGSDSWQRHNPATWIAAGLPAYDRRRLEVLKECNVNTIYCNLGTNDAAAPTNVATVKPNCVGSVNYWKTVLPPFRLGLATILPKVDNTGNFSVTRTQKSVLLQQTLGGFGSFRSQWNKLVMSPDVTMPHDFGIDLCGKFENDPVAFDNRIVSMDGATAYPYSVEGTHPNYTGSDLIAQTAEVIGRPLRNIGKVGLQSKTLQVNFNITTDQRLYLPPEITAYRIKKITVTNASVPLTTAAGGIYSASGKGGTVLVAAAQSYSSLSAATDAIDLTLAAGASGSNLLTFTGSLFFSLTTSQGVAATADIIIDMDDFS